MSHLVPGPWSPSPLFFYLPHALQPIFDYGKNSYQLLPITDPIIGTTLKNVTRFYKHDPNRTSGKIKLTPPVDSYTIVLVDLTLGTTQTTRGWFQQASFLVVCRA